jgi:hypothetical protein
MKFAIKCDNQNQANAIADLLISVGWRWRYSCSEARFRSNKPTHVSVRPNGTIGWWHAGRPISMRAKCYACVDAVDVLSSIPLMIAEHTVTDIGPEAAMVGCTRVTYEEVCAVKEAMEAKRD